MTIPKDVRRIHQIAVGDTVLFAIEGNKVDFMKMERDTILTEAAGSWKVAESGVDYVRKIRSGWARRQKRVGL